MDDVSEESSEKDFKNSKVYASEDYDDEEDESLSDVTDGSYDDSEKDEELPRKRAAHGGFILDEAQESDESYGSSGGEEVDLIQKDIFTVPRSNKSILDRAFRQNDEEKIQEYVKKWTTARDEDTIESTAETAKSSSIYKKRLLPTVNDPNLWMVRCKLGEEANAAFALMRKFIYCKNKGKPLQISSAVHQNGIKGYIYVEARKQNYVKEAIKDISSFFRGNNDQKMVALEEMPDILKVVKEKIIVEPRSWVRVKKGEYKDDLAFVEEVDPYKERVLLKLVPRLDYQNLHLTAKEYAQQKMFSRPEKAPFDIKTFSSLGLKYTDLGNGQLRHGSKLFIDGFLFKYFPFKAIIIDNVKPKVDELKYFESSKSNNDSNISQLAAIQEISSNNLRTDEDDLPIENVKIEDVVQITRGEMVNLVGTVKAINGKTLVLRSNNQEVEILYKNVRKYFKVGDMVTVMSGELCDKSGMVVRIEGNLVVVFSNETNQEFQVFSKDLKYFTSLHSGMDDYGNFQVDTFVKVDSSTLGYIIEVQRDKLIILNDQNRIHKVDANTVQPFKIHYGTHKDCKGSPIKIGDKVKLSRDPTTGNKIYTIKMFFKNSVFLFCKEIKENKSMIVMKHKDVELVNSQMPQRNSFSNNYGVDLQTKSTVPMSPRLHAGDNNEVEVKQLTFNGNNQNNFNQKKDLMQNVGKSVRIMGGVYKGYYGIIKNITHKTAQIELHANCRTITVILEYLSLPGHEGSSFCSNSITRVNPNSSVGMSTGLQNTPGNMMKTPNLLNQFTPSNEFDGGMTPNITRKYSSALTPLHESNTLGVVTPLGSGYMTPSSNSIFGNSMESAHTPRYNYATPRDDGYSYGSMSSNIKGSYTNEMNENTKIHLTDKIEVMFMDSSKGFPTESKGSIVQVKENFKYLVSLQGSNQKLILDESVLNAVRPKEGDRMKILHGEYKGYIGKVVSIENLKIKYTLVDEFDGEEYKIPIEYTAKCV